MICVNRCSGAGGLIERGVTGLSRTAGNFGLGVQLLLPASENLPTPKPGVAMLWECCALETDGLALGGLEELEDWTSVQAMRFWEERLKNG